MMSPWQEKNSTMKLGKIVDNRRLLIISRVFDQIQVFAQMLGGYFEKKKENSEYDKIENGESL